MDSFHFSEVEVKMRKWIFFFKREIKLILTVFYVKYNIYYFGNTGRVQLDENNRYVCDLPFEKNVLWHWRKATKYLS